MLDPKFFILVSLDFLEPKTHAVVEEVFFFDGLLNYFVFLEIFEELILNNEGVLVKHMPFLLDFIRYQLLGFFEFPFFE